MSREKCKNGKMRRVSTKENEKESLIFMKKKKKKFKKEEVKNTIMLIQHTFVVRVENSAEVQGC